MHFFKSSKLFTIITRNTFEYNFEEFRTKFFFKITVYRASGDLESAKEARLKWRMLNKSYEAYSLRNGRAYYPWRTRITLDEKEYATYEKVIIKQRVDNNIIEVPVKVNRRILEDVTENKHTLALSVEKKLTSDMMELANKSDIKLVGLEHRLKTKDSLQRKMRNEYAEAVAKGENITLQATAEKMSDVNRYTAIIDVEKFVDKYFDVHNSLIAKGYEVVKVKNTFKVSDAPYKGINNNYRTPDGVIFELQFHTEESFYMKEKINHPLYEECRNIETSDERIKELTEKMKNNSKTLTIPKNIDKI